MRKRYRWPGVYPHRNARGEITSYVVDLGLQEVPGETKKKRLRYFYKTQQEAQTKAEQIRIARKNETLTTVAVPAANLLDAERAAALLLAYNVTLEDAAKFYVAHAGIIQQKVSVGDVVAELISIKERDGRAARYVRDLRVRLGVFARAQEFASRPIHEISSSEIDDWLRALNGGAINRKNYRRLISVLFGFALKRKYVVKNPIKEVEIPTITPTKPGILSLPEVKGLLAAATPEFLPAIVLQLFAGLRPESELWRLSWENIDLAERLIDVAASKNSASHRYVKIEDNLAAWLEPYAQNCGPICLTDEPYFRRMRETRERAAKKLEAEKISVTKLRDWPVDCLRHCYASYHCGHFKDSRRTSEEMGHSGDLTIFNYHYRNRVKPADAAAYWGLGPASARSV